MASLRDIFVRLGVKTDPKGFKQADRGLGNIVKAAKTAAVALAGLQVVRSVRSMVTETAALGDSIDKVSSKLGVNAQALQELRFAADQTGVAQSNMDMGLQRFTRRASEAAEGTGVAKDALAELGVRLKDSQGRLRPVEELIGDVAEGFKNTGTDADRVRLAFKLFDSEGVNLVNTLKGGRAGLEALRKKARETGGVLEDDLIKSSVQYTDDLSEMRLAFQGVRNAIAANLLPAVSALMTRFTDFLKTNRAILKSKLDYFFARVGRVLRSVKEFVGDVADAFTEWSDSLGPVGKQILRITGIVLALVAALMLPGIPILLLIGLIALLIDDFQTWRKGGESVIGDIIDLFQGLMATMWEVIETFRLWVEEHQTGIALATSLVAGLASVIAGKLIVANKAAVVSFIGLNTAVGKWIRFHLLGAKLYTKAYLVAAKRAVMTSGVWMMSAAKTAKTWVIAVATMNKAQWRWFFLGLKINAGYYLMSVKSAALTAAAWVASAAASSAAWIASAAATSAAWIASAVASAAAWLASTIGLVLTVALLAIIVGTLIWLGRELYRLATGQENFFTTMWEGIQDLIDKWGGIGPAIGAMLDEALRFWLDFFGLNEKEVDTWIENLTDTLMTFWDNIVEHWTGVLGRWWDKWSNVIDIGFGGDDEADTEERARRLFERSEARRKARETGPRKPGEARAGRGGGLGIGPGAKPSLASIPSVIAGGGAVTNIRQGGRGGQTVVDNRTETFNVSVSSQPGMDERRLAQLAADMTAAEVRRARETEYRQAAQAVAVEAP